MKTNSSYTYLKIFFFFYVLFEFNFMLLGSSAYIKLVASLQILVATYIFDRNFRPLLYTLENLFMMRLRIYLFFRDD